MCGINGFSWNDPVLLERMNSALSHRGPDGRGVFSDGRISLGHTLLALTASPDNSRQPVVSEDGRYVFAYNGELYNDVELRSRLRNKGIAFKTDSDTEVFFRGLSVEGLEFLSSVEGMFAFALYDRDRETITLGRDRHGMKQIFFHHNSHRFIFSSEQRGLHVANIARNADSTAIPLFFALGYVPGEKTLFKSISKVRPGELVTYYCASGRLLKRPIDISPSKVMAGALFADVKGYIRESVRRHARCVRPYGLYLSGGMDSGIILHELAKNGSLPYATYTTRFAHSSDSYNEDAEVAATVAARYGVRHEELLITEDAFISAIAPTIRAMEEPRYNPSVPAYWLMAKEAGKSVRMVLSGSGGDELFLGYPKYHAALRVAQAYHFLPRFLADTWYGFQAFRFGHTRAMRPLPMGTTAVLWARLNAVNPAIMDVRELAAYISDNCPSMLFGQEDMVTAFARYDRALWLADEEFARTDKILMQFGMEGRYPLLTETIANCMDVLPTEIKMPRGILKGALRDAYRFELPAIIRNKRKSGWKAPVNEWMNSRLGVYVDEVLSPSYYAGTARVFSPTFLSGINQGRSRLKDFFGLFSFQIWARENRITL